MFAVCGASSPVTDTMLVFLRQCDAIGFVKGTILTSKALINVAPNQECNR